MNDPYLPPGTHVVFSGNVDAGPEYGVVVHCWMDANIGMHDCYVAFFGREFPKNTPSQTPYILRYAAVSLEVVGSPNKV